MYMNTSNSCVKKSLPELGWFILAMLIFIISDLYSYRSRNVMGYFVPHEVTSDFKIQCPPVTQRNYIIIEIVCSFLSCVPVASTGTSIYFDKLPESYDCPVPNGNQWPEAISKATSNCQYHETPWKQHHQNPQTQNPNLDTIGRYFTAGGASQRCTSWTHHWP